MKRGPKPHPHRGALPGPQQPVPATGSTPQLGADQTGQLPRRRITEACETLASQLTPKATPPKRPVVHHGSHLTQILATGGPADAGGQPPAVGPAARGLDPRTQTLEPTQQAAVLPVTALGGNIKATLNRAAPECAAVLFEHINRLTNLARYAEKSQLYAEAMEASNLAGRLAIKTIEMTVGKQLNVTATLTSQSTIPAWDKLPQAAKDYYKDMANSISQLPEPDTSTVVEGTVVPQTDEAYEEGRHDPTEGAREN